MGFRCATIKMDKLAEQLSIDMDSLNMAMRNSRTGGIARLWSFEDKGNFGTGRVSVSSKKDQNSDYETQFQDGYVCLSGPAYKRAKEMEIPEKGVSIVILSCDVRNKYDSKSKKLYTNYYIYDFETFDRNESDQSAGKSAKSAAKAPAKNSEPEPNGEDADEDELPF